MNKIVFVLLLLVIVIVQIDGASPLVANFTWTPVCGNQIQFTDNSTGNPGGWQWSFGNNGNTGEYSSGSQNPSVYMYAGTHTVSLTIENGYNSSTTSQTVVIPPATPLIASFTATPSSGPLPLTVQFTDTSSSPCPITSRGWNFGDGSGGSTVQNPTHTFTEPCSDSTGNNTIPVTLIEWMDGIQQAQKTTYIIITNQPNPVSSFTATPSSGPAPLSVQFDDTSSNNPTVWNWQFGDGTTSNQQNPSHNYTISGVYIVTMQAMSSTKCYSTNTVTSTITVLSPLAPGTTTSPTLSPNQTVTTTTSTTPPTTTVTPAQTTPPAATLTQMMTATPSGFYFTPHPTTTTQKVFTPIPTVTPTQKSPFGIEFSILAISAAILIVRSQYRKP